MVDRAYKTALPRMKADLEKLRRDFGSLGATKTNWTRLRIEPLLRHVDSLERVLRSDEFSGEASRLRKGVVFFHSDLVYLRANIDALKELIESERRSQKR